MRTLTVLLSASALLGGCVGVPPAVNPTVEVWNVQPTANTDIADVIIEQVIDQVFSLASSESDSGCLFWCFHERGARPSHPAPQPVAAPVVYQYTSYSEPPRPLTIKPAPRPVHVVASKEHAPRQTTHTTAAKTPSPKPSKPAVAPKSDKKKDKR